MQRTAWLAVPALLLLAGCGATAAAHGGHHRAHGPLSSTQETGSASGTATVAVRTATVQDRTARVLTTPTGMTLYYYTPDTPTHVACSGSCESVWPALDLGAGQPVAPAGLGGALTAVRGPNGLQVEYNGHPLYTFTGDKRPGQANGEGVAGIWFVAQPSLTPTGGSSGSSYGGSGY